MFLSIRGSLVNKSTEPTDCEYTVSINGSVQLAADLFIFEATPHEPYSHKYVPWGMMLPNLIVCLSLLLLQKRMLPPEKISLFTVGMTLNCMVFTSVKQMHFGVERFGDPEIGFC